MPRFASRSKPTHGAAALSTASDPATCGGWPLPLRTRCPRRLLRPRGTVRRRPARASLARLNCRRGHPVPGEARRASQPRRAIGANNALVSMTLDVPPASTTSADSVPSGAARAATVRPGHLRRPRTGNSRRSSRRRATVRAGGRRRATSFGTCALASRNVVTTSHPIEKVSIKLRHTATDR